MCAFLSIYTSFHKVQPHVYGYTYISVFIQIDWRTDTDIPLLSYICPCVSVCKRFGSSLSLLTVEGSGLVTANAKVLP